MIELFQSGLVTAVELSDRSLAFVTSIDVRDVSGQIGVLVPEVDPLGYTYGLALFLSLMLASHAGWRKSVLGCVALLPFQAWGVAFDLLAQVGIFMSPEIAARSGLIGWRRELTAFGYQMGALILPTLGPVVAWGLMSAQIDDVGVPNENR